MPTDSQPIRDDLLSGAEAIAEFMFGHGAMHRRKVYYLAASGALPVFRLGKAVCARRSTLRGYLEEKERSAVSAAA